MCIGTRCYNYHCRSFFFFRSIITHRVALVPFFLLSIKGKSRERIMNGDEGSVKARKDGGGSDERVCPVMNDEGDKRIN